MSEQAAGKRRAERLMEGFEQCEQQFESALHSSDSEKLTIWEAKQIIRTDVEAPLPYGYGAKEMMLSFEEEHDAAYYDRKERCLKLN